jgi:hypothetical protein
VAAIGKVALGARYTLGGIRMLTGTLGLVAPTRIAQRLGDPAPERNAAAIYGIRLFGVRTILIGLDLFRLRGTALHGALRSAVLIHASDTATVLSLQQSAVLAPEKARPLAAISGLNTVLSVIAFLGNRRSPQ